MKHTRYACMADMSRALKSTYRKAYISAATRNMLETGEEIEKHAERYMAAASLRTTGKRRAGKFAKAGNDGRATRRDWKRNSSADDGGHSECKTGRGEGGGEGWLG